MRSSTRGVPDLKFLKTSALTYNYNYCNYFKVYLTPCFPVDSKFLKCFHTLYTSNVADIFSFTAAKPMLHCPLANFWLRVHWETSCLHVLHVRHPGCRVPSLIDFIPLLQHGIHGRPAASRRARLEQRRHVLVVRIAIMQSAVDGDLSLRRWPRPQKYRSATARPCLAITSTL